MDIRNRLRTLSLLAILLILISCNSSKKEIQTISRATDSLSVINIAKDSVIHTDNVEYDARRNNLTLSVSDTIKKFYSMYFSSQQSKDLFLLTIEPGMVKNAKARLQIISSDKRVLYTQNFDAFYFIRDIFMPDTIPTVGGQDAYEKYMESYWKSITVKQYSIFFKKSVDNFFEAINAIEKDKYIDFKDWDDINDKDYLEEVMSDSTLRLINISCFDCDEGGSIIGYSRKQNKVKVLLEHD
jgi:hypothetical protein